MRDANALGIDISGLSKSDRDAWIYLYYNFRDPKGILSKYGTGWVLRPASPKDTSIQNVKRVGATTDLMRQIKLFDAP